MAALRIRLHIYLICLTAITNIPLDINEYLVETSYK
jgi:hypothetical protein